jgi:hypothetical protein
MNVLTEESPPCVKLEYHRRQFLGIMCGALVFHIHCRSCALQCAVYGKISVAELQLTSTWRICFLAKERRIRSQSDMFH